MERCKWVILHTVEDKVHCISSAIQIHTGGYNPSGFLRMTDVSQCKFQGRLQTTDFYQLYDCVLTLTVPCTVHQERLFVRWTVIVLRFVLLFFFALFISHPRRAAHKWIIVSVACRLLASQSELYPGDSRPNPIVSETNGPKKGHERQYFNLSRCLKGQECVSSRWRSSRLIYVTSFLIPVSCWWFRARDRRPHTVMCHVSVVTL